MNYVPCFYLGNVSRLNSVFCNNIGKENGDNSLSCNNKIIGNESGVNSVS